MGSQSWTRLSNWTELNWTEERTVNKFMKRCLSLLITKEVQVKTTLKRLCLSDWQRFKRLLSDAFGEDCRHPCMSDGSISPCISGGPLGSIFFEVIGPTGCPSTFLFFVQHSSWWLEIQAWNYSFKMACLHQKRMQCCMSIIYTHICPLNWNSRCRQQWNCPWFNGLLNHGLYHQ